MNTVGTFLLISVIFIGFIYINFSQIYYYLVEYTLKDENVNFIKKKMVDIDKIENEKMEKENPNIFDKSFQTISDNINNITILFNTFFSNIYEYILYYLSLFRL